MTNQKRYNPCSKIPGPYASISRHGPPGNNCRKSNSSHVALPHSRVPPSGGAYHPNRQPRSPVLPVPPNAPPLLPGLLRKASSGLVTDGLRSSDWSKDWNARHKPMVERYHAPYQSVSSAWNSRRSLKNAGGALPPLSTSSKVNTGHVAAKSSKVDTSHVSTKSSKINNGHVSTTSSNVNNAYKSTQSKLDSTKNNANAQVSTHRPSQIHTKSPPRPTRKGVRPRTSANPSSPKGKPSPTHTAKRRAHLPPPPPLSLERPTSPQAPSLNPQQWKHQVRVSTKRDIVPEHATRPAEPVFPLVSQSLRKNLSSRLRKQDYLQVPLPCSGHSGKVDDHNKPRVNNHNAGVHCVVHNPPQEQRHVVSVGKPDLNLSSDDDKTLTDLFGPHVRLSTKSPPKGPKVIMERLPTVDTLVKRPRPISARENTSRIQTSKCKNGDARLPPVADTPGVVEPTSWKNIEKNSQQNSVPPSHSASAIVPPLKKRRVVEDEDVPKPRVVPETARDGSRALTSLDLRRIEEPSGPKNSGKVVVSPICITEAPFEVSFQDPVMAGIRGSNGTNKTCLLGDSVKNAPRGTPADQRRRHLSFERKRRELSRPTYIADPYDSLMMEEALAAVSIKFEKHV